MGDSKRWNGKTTPNEDARWMPPAICEKELVVTYIESPCMFWASLVNQIGKQVDIDTKLANLCATLPKIKSEPVLGKTYGCMYSFDNNWYRCKVTLVINKSHVEVLYVDYGNREVVEKSNLVELPQFLSDLHILAYPYWLLGLKSIRHESTIEKGVEFLESLKSSNHFTATLFSKTKDSVIPITVILDSGQDLGDLMVQKKFCTYMTNVELKQKFPATGSKTQSTKSNLERTKSLVSGDAFSASSPYRTVGKNGQPMDTLSRTQSISNVPKGGYNRAKSKSPIKLVKLRSMSGDPSQHDAELGRKGDETRMATKHLMEKKSMEHGMEQLSLELTESSNEVLSLQLANSNLKNEIEKQKKSIHDLGILLKGREAFFDSKLKNLVNYSRSVYSLRLRITRQEELRIDMDRVCDMLLSMQPSNPMLRKIASVHAVFENLQNKIKDKTAIDEELNKLISARDSARKLLHSDLEEFLYKTSPFPFEEMFIKVKGLLRDLVRPSVLEEFEKSDFLNNSEGSIVGEINEEKYQNALLSYRSWRSRNLKDHRFYEAKLDEKKNILSHAFGLVINALNDEEGRLIDTSSLNNVDMIVKEYEVSANEESNFLLKALGEKFEDVKLPNIPIIENEHMKDMLILRSGDWLWNSIEGLLYELGRVEKFMKKNKLLVAELAQWLVKIPSVTNLQEVMKVVKVLKSQLRHQLADHADLEEDKACKVDVTNDESTKIRLLNKLNQTRAALQERLELNDDIMLSMLESDLKQFPELIIFHPDIPFNNYMQHTPIVRQGRSLDQYYTQAVHSEPNSFKSVYIGKPVILQEYFLLNKTFKQFEVSINKYLSCFVDQSVNRIEFIFQDARKQTGVVQSLYREHNFGKMLDMNSDENMMLYMLYNILVDLQSMHRMNIVHACLNPSYILYDSDNWMAFIRPYNFNLSPMERSKENVWKEIRFTAPEVLQCISDTHTSTTIDMFAFGLLLYQTHRPLEQGCQSSSILQILEKELSSPKIDMIKRLLNENPNNRPTADELLKTPFWLEVAVDYQKGKAFMMKQVAVATENSEKAVAMLIDNMQSNQTEVVSKCNRAKMLPQVSEETYSLPNEDEVSSNSSRKKERKRSRVKFEIESEESSTVEEEDESEAGEGSEQKKDDDASSDVASDDNSDNQRDRATPCSDSSDLQGSNSLEQRMFGVKRFPRTPKRKPKDSEDEYDEYDDYDSQGTNQ